MRHEAEEHNGVLRSLEEERIRTDILEEEKRSLEVEVERIGAELTKVGELVDAEDNDCEPGLGAETPLNMAVLENIFPLSVQYFSLLSILSLFRLT